MLLMGIEWPRLHHAELINSACTKWLIFCRKRFQIHFTELVRCVCKNRAAVYKQPLSAVVVISSSKSFSTAFPAKIYASDRFVKTILKSNHMLCLYSDTLLELLIYNIPDITVQSQSLVCISLQMNIVINIYKGGGNVTPKSCLIKSHGK